MVAAEEGRRVAREYASAAEASLAAAAPGTSVAYVLSQVRRLMEACLVPETANNHFQWAGRIGRALREADWLADS